MATTKTFNNSTYSIPSNREPRGWGTSLSNFLIDVADNALSKAGGNFTLTADVNFGTNFGIYSKYIKYSSGTLMLNTSGTVTLPNATDTLVGKATTDTLTNKTITSPVISGATFSDGSVVFEGTTADAFETTLAVTDPTADRTITFPDSTGTVALTSGVINNSLLTTTGDTIYASSSSTPARLAIGTAGQTLTVSAGGVPEWATPAAGTTANDQAFAFAVQVFA